MGTRRETQRHVYARIDYHRNKKMSSSSSSLHSGLSSSSGKLVATFRSSCLIKNKSRSRALSFRGKSSSANSSSSSKATMIFNETSSSSSKAEGKKCEQQRKQNKRTEMGEESGVFRVGDAGGDV